MNTRCLAFFALVLVACEGEAPKMPTTPSAPAAGPAAELTDEPAVEPTPAVAPSAAALPPCACNCNCAGPTSSDAGAPGEGGATAAVATAPAPAPASISGTVTTLPKSAAASAVVYIEDAPIEPTAKMSTTVVNRTMTFSPFISVVPVGGRGVFRNDDPFPHNVFSPDNERFNLGMIAQHAAVAHVFKSAGVYTLLCNLHPGMLGYFIVPPSSYFAKTDAQGHYSIKNVPPGTYKVTAWAPRQQPFTQPVTVKDGDVPLNFDIHR